MISISFLVYVKIYIFSEKVMKNNMNVSIIKHRKGLH